MITTYTTRTAANVSQEAAAAALAAIYPSALSEHPETVASNDNYFRGSDIAPRVDNGRIMVMHGHGPRRYWGSWSVTANVGIVAADLIVIDVTGWHKHTKRGPVGGRYYFIFHNGGWIKTTAANKIVKARLSETAAATANG